MNTIKDFLKKHWFTELVIIAAIVFIILFGIGRCSRAKLYAENEVLKNEYSLIQIDRDSLKVKNVRLVKANITIQKSKDSIIAVKITQEITLAKLIRKHRREIDSLTNAFVTTDSVYKRLQPIYPNIDDEALLYPFAGGQVRQIYATAVSYPRIRKQYELQTGLLLTCNSLNGKYQAAESNYKAQLENLNKNIADCDAQVANKDAQLDIAKKQINRKSFWNWVYKGAAIVLGGIIIFK